MTLLLRRAALPLLAALLLSGCALLPNATAPAAEAAASPPPPPLRVAVEAPDALADLLQRHLDIARLGALAGGEPVQESELARLLAAAPAQARELLQTEGYFGAEVTVERSGDLARVRVQPGPRARVGRLDIELQGELQERAEAADAQAQALVARMRLAWPLPPDAPFRNADWRDAKAELLTRLRAGGYAAASWIGTAADVDPATQRVRLFLVADSGPLFRAGPLLIEGLEHHDEITVKRLAGFDVGASLTETRLLDFQDRLRESGLFDTIAVTFEPDAATAGATPVRVRLRESPRQVWTFGIGYADEAGPRASVEHLHRRLFGLPFTSRNKLEWGGSRQAWDGEIATHPQERQYRWLVGGAIERLEGEDDTVLSQRLRAGRAQNLPRIDRLAFVEVERSSRRNLSAAATLPESTELAVSANYHGVWRYLDSPILPTEGWSISLQGGAGRASGTDSASGWFGRAYGRLTGYLPLPR
jgi:translocation and assembly module TamA